jgi:hypothetical protein
MTKGFKYKTGGIHHHAILFNLKKREGGKSD